MAAHTGQQRSRWRCIEVRGDRAKTTSALDLVAGVVPPSALEERQAILGTSGAGNTYAAERLAELLLDQGARVCVVNPLGVWKGLRSDADEARPGYPVVAFGGRHAEVAVEEGRGAAPGRPVGTQPLARVVALSELGSPAARRRFMAAFGAALYQVSVFAGITSTDAHAVQVGRAGWRPG